MNGKKPFEVLPNQNQYSLFFLSGSLLNDHSLMFYFQTAMAKHK